MAGAEEKKDNIYTNNTNPSPEMEIGEVINTSGHTQELGELINASGHVQELDRNFSLLAAAGVGLVVGNVWPVSSLFRFGRNVLAMRS